MSDHFSVILLNILAKYRSVPRVPVVFVIHVNVRKCFLSPAYSFSIPVYNTTFPYSCLHCEVKQTYRSRSKGKNDITHNISELSARKQAANILYEMYNLTGCAVISRNLRSRKTYGRKTIFRYTLVNQSMSFWIFYPTNVIPSPSSSKYRTRIYIRGTHAVTRVRKVTLQLEQMYQARPCRTESHGGFALI